MKARLIVFALVASCAGISVAQVEHMHGTISAMTRFSKPSSTMVPTAISSTPTKDPAVLPTTHYEKLILTNAKLSPDGGPVRQVILINGKYLGPTIVMNAGDRLVVKVVNKLSTKEGATIHWHGIYQNGTNDMDGVPGITQPSIGPGETFTYNFTLDVPGSYWYHSHWKVQYIDGLRGSLVVRNTAKGDHHHGNPVIAMSETYFNYTTAVLNALLDTNYTVDGKKNIFGNPPIPDGCLINDHGQANAKCQKAVEGSKSCSYSTVEVSQAEPCDCSNDMETCRKKGGVVRLVSTSGYSTFNVTIDEHLMWVVAADSVPIVPTKLVGSIRLNVAQRYDVVLCRVPALKKGGSANTSPAWIRASMDAKYLAPFFKPAKYKNPNVLGILKYISAPPALPTTKAWPNGTIRFIDERADLQGGNERWIDPFNLVPLEFPVPPQPTVQVTLVSQFFNDPVANGLMRAHINNQSWTPTNEIKPPLINYARKHIPYPPNMNPGPNVYSVEFNDVVEVVINNEDGLDHPFHLHGQNFWIVSRGATAFIPGNYPVPFNFTSRDTATVPARGHLVIRFAATNPGLWIMHCHIDWHLAAGLGMVWSVGLGQ